MAETLEDAGRLPPGISHVVIPEAMTVMADFR